MKSSWPAFNGGLFTVFVVGLVYSCLVKTGASLAVDVNGPMPESNATRPAASVDVSLEAL